MEMIATMNDLSDDQAWQDKPYEWGDVIIVDRAADIIGYARNQFWVVTEDPPYNEEGCIQCWPFSTEFDQMKHLIPIKCIWGKASWSAIKEYERFYGLSDEFLEIFQRFIYRVCHRAWIDELFLGPDEDLKREEEMMLKEYGEYWRDYFHVEGGGR